VPESKSRSRAVIAISALLAVAAGGWLGYLLRESPKPIGPQALQIEVVSRLSDSDLRSTLEPRLETLIEQPGHGEAAERAAVLRSIALAARRDQPTADWISSRLQTPDFPELIMLELLGEVGSEPRGKAIVREFLLGRLGSDSAELQQQGIRLIRRLRLGQTATSGGCLCRGGIFPAQPSSVDQRFFVAWPLKETTQIHWSPRTQPGAMSSWSLHLERGNGESPGSGLVQRVARDVNISSLELQAGGPQIGLQSLD